MPEYLRHALWLVMIAAGAWLLAGCPSGNGGSGGY
jgi:hypothetical protein